MSADHPALALYGLFTIRTEADGNCLFNALSDQIFGHQARNQEIRARVVNHMRNNANDYKAFVVVNDGGGQRRNPRRKNASRSSSDSDSVYASAEQVDKNYERYLRMMARPGVYGDNVEIRAFSKEYNIDVKVYKKDSVYYVKAHHDNIVRHVAHIAYHQTWEHYSSVRNIKGPLTGLPNIFDASPSVDGLSQFGDEASKGVAMQESMVKATNLPCLPFSDEEIKRSIENHGSSVVAAIDQFLAAVSSSPETLADSWSETSAVELDSDTSLSQASKKRRRSRGDSSPTALRQESSDRKKRSFHGRGNSFDEPITFDEVSTLPIRSSAASPTKQKSVPAHGMFFGDIFSNTSPDVGNDASSERSASTPSLPDVSICAPPPQKSNASATAKSAPKDQAFRRIKSRERKEIKKRAQTQARIERQSASVTPLLHKNKLHPPPSPESTKGLPQIMAPE